MPTDQVLQEFRDIVWQYSRAHWRDMPWRSDPTPYNALVSEIMLQQTQVSRVLPKFELFVSQFPTIQDLAKASLASVLVAWNGLGYNRRAKFLHAGAIDIVSKGSGRVPNSIEELIKLPGIGPNTAGAIMAYAYNQPVVFVETNIRTVFFYHFFAGQDKVDDKELLPFVQRTLDVEHPREWYWALMDYGTHLKQTVGNNISRSKQYSRQSKFEGSRRQIRGEVIRRLAMGRADISDIIDDRLEVVVDDLIREGLVERSAGQIRLTQLAELP